MAAPPLCQKLKRALMTDRIKDTDALDLVLSTLHGLPWESKQSELLDGEEFWTWRTESGSLMLANYKGEVSRACYVNHGNWGAIHQWFPSHEQIRRLCVKLREAS